MPETTKREQRPIKSQTTHRKCKGDGTGDLCATDMKKFSIWLANKAGSKITEIARDQFKVATNALGLRKQDNTNGICAVDVEQISVPLANNAENEITQIMTC